MLVKLSGERYINTERICAIRKKHKQEYKDSRNKDWVAVTVVVREYDVYEVDFGGTLEVLSETQFAELMQVSCGIVDGERALKRKRLIERIGASKWYEMSKDEQYDAVSAEVSHAAS